MNCQQFREMIDSYISDELLVETNHDFLRHLETCPSCRQEFTMRRNLRSRVRSAVQRAPEMQINPNFAAQLRANLHESVMRPRWWEIGKKNDAFPNMRTLLAAAMCLLVAAGIGIVWIKYGTTSPEKPLIAENPSNSSNGNARPLQSPTAQAVQIAWREITDCALGDHENCALVYRLKEKPITLEEAAKKYGKFNKDLDQAVIRPLREVFPEGSLDEIKLLEAHSCVFEGRRFAHVVLSRQNHRVSVLVTSADLPDEIGEKIVSQTTGNMQVASFRTKHHAVFVVSDMTAQENFTVAQTITTSVRRHVEKDETNDNLPA